MIHFCTVTAIAAQRPCRSQAEVQDGEKLVGRQTPALCHGPCPAGPAPCRRIKRLGSPSLERGRTTSPSEPPLPDTALVPTLPGGLCAPSELPLPSASPAPPSPRSCQHGGFGRKCATLTRRERSGSQHKILLDPHSLGGNQITDVTAGKRQLVPTASAFPVWECSPHRHSRGNPKSVP